MSLPHLLPLGRWLEEETLQQPPKTQISSSFMSFRVCCLDSVLCSFHCYIFPSLSFYNKISLIFSFPSALSSCIIYVEANKSCLNQFIPIDFLTVWSTTNLTNRRQLHVTYLGALNLHRWSILLDPTTITQSHLNSFMTNIRPRARKKSGFPMLHITHLG